MTLADLAFAGVALAIAVGFVALLTAALAATLLLVIEIGRRLTHAARRT